MDNALGIELWFNGIVQLAGVDSGERIIATARKRHTHSPTAISATEVRPVELQRVGAVHPARRNHSFDVSVDHGVDCHFLQGGIQVRRRTV